MGALERFQRQGDQIKDAYSSLQDEIFRLIINALKEGDYQHVDKDDVVLWQAQQLQKIGQLNRDTMRLMAQTDGVSQQSIEDFVKFNGLDVADEVDDELQQVAPQRTAMPAQTSIGSLMAGIAQQTWTNLQNNVNESLVSRNYGESSVTYTYRQILTESTAATVSGLLTHQDAVESAIYRAVDRGLPTRLVDKAGHRWSMEGYTNMVVNTTTHQAYNEIRLKRIKDFGIGQCVMSSHTASRPACAPIQGQVVNVVPPESDDYDDRYDSIYNHGYGEPWGTQGINCYHRLFPFVPGVSVNHQPQYDPDEAIKNGKIVQQQRARERAIRDAKHRLAVAEELGDVKMIIKTKTLIRARQSKMREFIKSANHGRKVPLLHRDYSREKIPKIKPKVQFHKDLGYNYRKKVKDKSSTPLSKAEMNKITKKFRRSGGQILTGPSVDKHLAGQQATAAAIGNDLIEFSSKAGRVEIHEELIHIKQNRRYGDPVNAADAIRREIEADEILLKNAKKWHLSSDEILATKRLKKLYTGQLKELGGWK